jgi:receptor protein-tyrosine kinase
MDLNEFLHVVRRQKVVVFAIAVAVLGTAFAGLQLVKPIYESTATLALAPVGDDSSLVFFSTIDSITPIYADAATSRTTRSAARAQNDGELGDVSVSTYRGTPILKLRARHTDPEIARSSAQAVAEVLLNRSRYGELGISTLRLSQLDRPAVPTSPVFPNHVSTIAVALVIGLMFGIGAALLRERLTAKVDTPEALAHVVGAPSFGEIPKEPAMLKLKHIEEFVTNPRLRAVSEALRDVRTNLLFSGETSTVLITSPEGSHGKTTVSVGLATTLARAGSRTVLVDGDMRKGRISSVLGVNQSPGLADALADAPLSAVLQPTSLPTLSVVAGGFFTENPGELLLNGFGDFLAELERRFDFVVIDGTPLVPVNDARIVARYAKRTIIVSSGESATRRAVRTAAERLRVIGIEPTAVVLNNDRRPRGRGYYGYLEAHPSQGGRVKRSSSSRWLRRAG